MPYAYNGTIRKHKFGGLVRVGVVVSTIGRSESFGLLLESLANQSHQPQEIIVVDQGEGHMVSDHIDLWKHRLPIIRMTSDKGVSLGRNTGWRALDDCDVVAFPDDDCTYGSSAFADVVREFKDPSILALSGRLTGSGDRLAFGGERADIDRKNVWTKAIEATTFYRHSVLKVLNGFDVELGIGADTAWQSGEGTDLLLRTLNLDGRAIYVPSIEVTEHQRETPSADYLRKVRLYARGTGRVYRMRYGVLDCALVIVRPVVAAGIAILRGRLGEAKAKGQAAAGRIEGMLPATVLRHPNRRDRP